MKRQAMNREREREKQAMISLQGMAEFKSVAEYFGFKKLLLESL